MAIRSCEAFLECPGSFGTLGVECYEGLHLQTSHLQGAWIEVSKVETRKKHAYGACSKLRNL